ncbi:endoribonuclease SymE [Erwinia amylovora]|uniref:Endoribonuclease SymE n=1 Tax=Erwinia amylovora ATCC BAA-2158 TaxID=889211 RepID=E5BAY1_ERWAM|nr:endoribonuclease SymE [Erwinia amylovora]CBX82642.1 Endoribonuclease symE [Erwinia amylovora ATCC BAA-2158]
MADTHDKPETRTPTTSRRYTVGYVRDSGTFEPLPAVTLKGGWLREAGFDTGTAVNVRVLPGCLILTAQEPQPVTEPEVLSQLRQACKKLSARKQRQIAEFIDVVAKPQKRTQHQI